MLKNLNKKVLLTIVGVLIMGALGLWLAFSDNPQDTNNSNESTNNTEMVEEDTTLEPEPATSTAEVEQRVTTDLADRLTLTRTEAANITIMASHAQTWPDSCLGLPKPDEMCAQMLTEGFKVIAEYRGQKFTYRTNSDGTMLRLE